MQGNLPDCSQLRQTRVGQSLRFTVSGEGSEDVVEGNSLRLAMTSLITGLASSTELTGDPGIWALRLHVTSEHVSHAFTIVRDIE